jgi:very-short-patch-repair endonuclease
MNPEYIAFIPAFFLLGALLDGLPYSYFQVLRWVTTTTSLVMLIQAHKNKRLWAIPMLGVIAILFNPVITISMSRQIWRVIDFITGIIFIFYGILEINLTQAQKKPQPHQPATIEKISSCDGKNCQQQIDGFRKVKCNPQTEGIFCRHILQQCVDTSEITPQYFIPNAGRKSRYIDFAIVFSNGKKLGIELDGYDFHVKIDKITFDDHLARHNGLVLQGWTLLHFSPFQYQNDPPDCIQQIKDAITMLR